MFDLSSKRVLVTGGSGSIGFAIAEHMANVGATVCITGTRAITLQHNVKQLAGNNHSYVVADMRDRKAIINLAELVKLKLGGVDILVNNAGINRDNISLRLTEEEWDQVIEVNLRSVFMLTQCLLRGMIKQKYGRIINISSVVGLTGNIGQVNYCASKAGLGGLTRALAREVASKNITVNCIAPGYIASAMTDKVSQDIKEKIISTIPCKRIGKPSDIASAVVYLASVQSSYITGETISINGGLHMS